MDDETSRAPGETDDSLAGWGAWSQTTIDDSIREIKAEMDEDFERDFDTK
ncbi:MAG: hypothetical protein ACOCP2_00150 [Halohasta sp.]